MQKVIFFIGLCIIGVVSIDLIVPNNISSSSTIGSTANKNNKDILSCMCDVTVQSCDLLCCCDQDCLPQQREDWLNNQVCLQSQNQKYENMNFPLCDTLGQNKQNIYKNQVNSITCIYVERLPSNGIFYQYFDTTLAEYKDTVSVTSERYIQKQYPSEVSVGTTTVGEGSYTSAKYLAVRDQSEQNTTKQLKYFTILSSDAFGYCSNSTPLLYHQDRTSSCVDHLIISELVDNTITEAIYRDRIVKLIDSIQIRNDVEGNITVTGKDLIKKPVFTLDGTTNKYYLSSALQKITITFSTSYSGSYETIQSATITVEEKQIDSASVSQQYELVDIFNYRITYEILFENPALILDNNTNVYKISGSYGYTNGLQLLVGQDITLNDNLSFESGRGKVRRNIDGFKVQINKPDGSCLLKDEIIADSIQDNVLKFGEDFTSTCKLQITQTECLTFSETFMDQYHFANMFKISTDSDFTVFGRYGIASVYLEKDWVPLKNMSTSRQSKFIRTFTNSQKAYFCDQYNSLNVIIYYSEAGPKEKGQQYIVSVEQTYGKDFSWRKKTQQAEVIAADQQFEFEFTVNIIFQKLDNTILNQDQNSQDNIINQWIKEFFGGIQSE